MVWKINKHKRTDKGNVIKQKLVIENQPPKLKSCLSKSSGIRSRSAKSRPASSRSAESNRLVESRGSGNSFSTHNKRIVSGEQYSVSSRSWDRESSTSETIQSNQSKSISEVKIENVRFNVIYIRDYERVVGDNPSCSTGPPVGIGWSYGKTRVIDVNSFESARSYRKSTSHLILTREEREALLLNWGASFHDIVEAVRGNLKIKVSGNRFLHYLFRWQGFIVLDYLSANYSIIIIKNQRRQTVTNLGKVERIEEAFESATRKLKSALMLRRSTGNKVKRLQEQANLAQSALTSLKIAEDRALSEIRGTRRVPIQEKPENKEDLESFATTNFGISSPEHVEGRRLHLIIPKENHACSSTGSTLGNNSTTQSELEIERFYRELELEMFGDEGPFSMVGQTLEVPVVSIPNNDITDLRLKNTVDSNEHYQDDFDDALLEQERNRSMISQYLLEDTENETSKVDRTCSNGEQDAVLPNSSLLQYTYPVHCISSRYQYNEMKRSSCISDWQDPKMTRVSESSTMARKYKESHHHQQTIPLHAGMTMFEDCALLGGQNSTYIQCEKKKRQSPRPHRDLDAGPKVQFIPPPTHISPSHWMEDSDQHFVPYLGHDTITIWKDNFGSKMRNGDQDHCSY